MNSISSFRPLFLTAVVAAGCSDTDSVPLVPLPDDARPYYLGMTTFPWELSLEAVEWNYERLGQDADLVAHHFDNGIPWQECLDGAPLPSKVTDDWNYRKARTPAGHKVYVAVTPIDSGRIRLALTWNESGDNQPLAAPWDGYDFNQPEVKTAYLEYCRRIVQFFDPDFLNIAVEANLIRENSPTSWNAFLELHGHVYGSLKAEFPALPVMVSVTAIDLLEGFTGADHEGQIEALGQLMALSDYYGISLHPHLSAYAPDLDLPADLFDRVFTLSGKPAALCETSFPADTLVLTDPVDYTCNGTPEKQRAYSSALLDKASQYNLRFVVNFLVRDYDGLCDDMGWTDGVVMLWRDTGFYDETGAARPALDHWREALSRPISAQ